MPPSFRAALQAVVQRADATGHTGKTRGMTCLCFPPIVEDLAFTQFGPWSWWLLVAVMLPVGAYAAKVTGSRLGAADSGHIVIDEIVAFWIVLLLLPGGAAQGSALLVAAFALCRLFDIVKPPPIRAIDANFKNGFGVMADDLVAAFYTLLALAVGLRLWG